MSPGDGNSEDSGGGGNRATGPMNAGAKRARSDVIQPFLLVHFGAVAAEKLGEKRVAWRLHDTLGLHGRDSGGGRRGVGWGWAGTLCCGCFEDSLSQKSGPED